MFDDAGYAVVDTSIGGPGGHLPPPWHHQSFYDHTSYTIT